MGLNQDMEPHKGIAIRPVRTGRDTRRFIDLPYRLYRRSEHWIAPLRMAQKDILNTRSHPFYQTSDVEMFLAERDGRVVGRIMAILNRAHNEFHEEHAGFFGFFESEDDWEAAERLLGAARDWLLQKGAKVMRGPVNPSTNYECGLLVEGLDQDPAVMMTYNPPYYAELFERFGLRKAMDLYAYDIDAAGFNMSDKLKRVAERLKQRDGITIRTVNIKDFGPEVEIVRKVYNDAWSRNWGFIPVSGAEFEHLAKDLKQIVDPKVVYIAEKKVGSTLVPVGFLLAVPDLNIALKKIYGRLAPFGLLKLLWHSRKIKRLRVITMGVVREYQSLGAAAIFYEEIYKQAVSPGGYPTAEMSWILENNVLMNRAADLIGGRRSKTYRIYEMEVGASDEHQ
ncbi:MAG: N-acetyltransferase [Blastocatellia bacterium AA13]|nr:MAG: N-acetyltransferase [Blastocatellia bacterium AA13]